MCIATLPHPEYAHVYEALDENTRRQLNRVEAMLNAICFKEGIETSTLPGYELSRLALPSSQSVSSTGVPIERMNLSDMGSEPPQKLGE